MIKPPFKITESILGASMRIMQLLGELDGLQMTKPQVLLRKSNQVKTIQASLAIEGNTLSIEQVTDVIEGVPVIAPEKDILEVKNAIKVYQQVFDCNYSSIADFKKSHKSLMKGLTKDAGQFRNSNVGVFSGTRVAHIAPQPKMLAKLVGDLFAFLKQKDSVSLLIKSCIFHYELEFIHPFSDGNGRMGRLWQHLILSAFHPVFRFLAIESLIKKNQKTYYKVLANCDAAGNSTAFIEFSLDIVEQELQRYKDTVVYQPKTAKDRLLIAKLHLEGQFTRKDYIDFFKVLSSATASRDLKFGVTEGLLMSTGEKRTTTYRFKT